MSRGTRVDEAGSRRPPRASRGLPLLGHLLELRRDPISLMQRVHDECGEIGEMRFARQPVVMLYGEKAQEAFFRAPDEQLDQAEAYPFMTPIFGRGVVFDATPEQRKEALRNQSLRDKMMRGHAEVIARETERMTRDWGSDGEVDLLDFLAELTLYTSSACLLGNAFREELTPEFPGLFHDLERGTDALAYVNPHLPIASFRKRDRARRLLVERIQDILDRRAASADAPRDLISILTGLRDEDGRPRYGADQITGMFISMMFAGHHTTSGTAAWTLIELLRHPHVMKEVVEELDALYADGREVSHQALREIPELECALKETLRLHPPLVLLMRKVMSEFRFGPYRVEPGALVAVSPAISNRMPEHFPDPERFDTQRYRPGRDEDRRQFAWLPFGAGRHRCVGATFAMVQLKTIFSVLLNRYDFELAQPPDAYRNDLSKMVIQIARPCRVRYRLRSRETAAGAARVVDARSPTPLEATRLEVDLDLCQGHGACETECPELFRVDPKALKVATPRSAVPAALRERAAAAVRACPTGALSLRER